MSYEHKKRAWELWDFYIANMKEERKETKQMNTYNIYLKDTGLVQVTGASYSIDKDKGYLYILNDMKWKIGIFFLDQVAGFTVVFGKDYGHDDNKEAN